MMDSYIKHVMNEAKEIEMKNRELCLYTNKDGEWSNHSIFKHPASFDTLALNPVTKELVLQDLSKFKSGKEYYAKVGKPWKRGYLLYGPPGTGKSTMIAAMANFMKYDVYDLELTAVKDNSELRELLIDTESRSIVVIEDIDCTLDLTRPREVKHDSTTIKKKAQEPADDSKVTLSGLLNVIDGIWSSCGGERIIVFTTNHVEKLDPALIRRGRMYCSFQVFKVLAKSYLDVESHMLFPQIEELLEHKQMTPSHVVENLMPKTVNQEPYMSFWNLIEALKLAKSKDEEEKEEIKNKAEEENKVEEKQRKKVEEKPRKKVQEERKPMKLSK